VGFEVWIIIVLAASVLSGWIGYAAARKGAPKQSELDAMASELDEARQQAESVQANVSEHFEQSALLFGKLAADYREFLDHFSASAQNLGLSESRARELIEQGFQPLLTHEAVEEAVVAEAPADEGATAEDEAAIGALVEFLASYTLALEHAGEVGDQEVDGVKAAVALFQGTDFGTAEAPGRYLSQAWFIPLGDRYHMRLEKKSFSRGITG